MPTNIRLTKNEQEKLEKKCLEINKILISLGKKPIKESELAHEIINNTIDLIKINDNGKIKF